MVSTPSSGQATHSKNTSMTCMMFNLILRITFLALAFFSYVSDSGFLLVCVVVLAKRCSKSLAPIIFGSSKMFHSVLLLRDRETSFFSPSTVWIRVEIYIGLFIWGQWKHQWICRLYSWSLNNHLMWCLQMSWFFQQSKTQRLSILLWYETQNTSNERKGNKEALTSVL